jgi:hypothetical protein
MTTGHASLDARLRRVVRFFGRGDGTDVPTLSLLVLAMSFVLVRNGLSSAVGIAALVIQIGLLVRITVLHGAVEQKAKANTEDR